MLPHKDNINNIALTLMQWYLWGWTLYSQFICLPSTCKTHHTISHYKYKVHNTLTRTHLRAVGPVYFVPIVLLGIVRSSDLDTRQTGKWLHSIWLQWKHVQCLWTCNISTLQPITVRKHVDSTMHVQNTLIGSETSSPTSPQPPTLVDMHWHHSCDKCSQDFPLHFPSWFLRYSKQ